MNKLMVSMIVFAVTACATQRDFQPEEPSTGNNETVSTEVLSVASLAQFDGRPAPQIQFNGTATGNPLFGILPLDLIVGTKMMSLQAVVHDCKTAQVVISLISHKDNGNLGVENVEWALVLSDGSGKLQTLSANSINMKVEDGLQYNLIVETIGSNCDLQLESMQISYL